MAHPCNGSWQLESSDGLVRFYTACGVPAADLERAKKLDVAGAQGPTEILNFDGSTLNLKVQRPDGAIVMDSSVPLNVETDTKSMDGRPIKVKVSNAGNSFTRTEQGDGYTTTWTRTIDGDNMTLVMKNGDNSCTRKYKRV